MRRGISSRTSWAARLGWLALASAFVLPGASAAPQDAGALVGTWTLVSSISEKDGKKREQFGTGATGMLSLDAGGHFMLTIISPDLPKFASGNRADATAQEGRAVVAGSIAMVGTYAFDPASESLVFNVESATFPNWNGTAQRRLITIASRDELKYVTPAASSGGVGTVTWKRAR